MPLLWKCVLRCVPLRYVVRQQNPPSSPLTLSQGSTSHLIPKAISRSSLSLSLFKINYLLLFILAVLGLCCCAWAFSSCGEWGLLFVAVRGLLIVMASLVAEHGL